jgi:hypothetical protein
MPIKHPIWTVGDKPGLLASDRLLGEQQLEGMIVADPSIFSPDWMVSGQREAARHLKSPRKAVESSSILEDL